MMPQKADDPASRPGLGPPKPASEGLKAFSTWITTLEGSSAAPLTGLLEKDPAARNVLAAVAGASPFLWRHIKAHPAWALKHLAGPAEPRLAALTEAMRAVPFDPDPAGIMNQLRKLRLEFAVAAGLADLMGLAILQSMAALTVFADAAVETATRLALLDAANTGKLDPPGTPDWHLSAGFFVLALGKHGAGELNYSSDIDLVVFYDPDRVPIRAGREIQPVMVTVTQRIVKLLHEVTPAGYVFRTDLRLRPDPGSTAIAMPVGAAMSYYESLGQNWERAAFIKARAVAGDALAGADFLRQLQPFIWRKYFDYAAIADIHAMKRQINVYRGFGEISIEGHDIKLGRGGIREIEFFVQTQQLVFGGRRPELRGARTLDTLRMLESDGWVGQKAVAELDHCYRLLRAVEHRLQMTEDEQTQRLPVEKTAFEKLAGFCGFSLARFRKMLGSTFETVARHYARLFEQGDDLGAAGGSLVFTGSDHDPETLETLRRLGFRNPEAASEMVRGWHFGRRPAVTSPRAREVLTEMTPALLTALGRTGDGDGGMRALDELFGRTAAAVELLALLKSNPLLLDLFAEMLGSAPRLAEIVARRPHALDHLIDPDFARRLPPDEHKARLAAQLQRPMELSSFLDTLRDVVISEKLGIGARMISGVIDPIEAGPAVTLIAEAAIEASLLAVKRELGARYGVLPGLQLAILGFGKLGGREMTATSDLDLVVIYDAPEGSQSNGAKALEPSEYCARLTQRLIAALSAPTAKGIAFEIDLRLRPSGNKGPVALALDSFLNYQRTEAEIWEQMALTRARPVTGDAKFCERMKRELAALIARPRDSAFVKREIAAMRGMIAREKGEDRDLDFKTGRGGLVDIEFIAQSLVLCHAHASTSLCCTATPDMVRAAGDLELVTPAEASTLLVAWRDWTSLSQASRSWFGELGETMPPAQARRLAAVLGLPDGRSLSGRIAEIRAEVRALFERLVGKLNR